MIIDVTQNKESVDISYVDDKNQIKIESIKFDNIDGNEYHNFVECDEYDPNRINELKSFYGKPIKLEPSKYFTHHNLNYFLTQELPKRFPEQFEKLNKLVTPLPFSIDIETDITEEFGYSDQEKVENSIRSISFTDINLNTILFIVKNEKHPIINDFDKGYIKQIITEALGEHAASYDYGFNIKIFDTEYEMLSYFVSCYREYLHVLIGWNVYGYDWQYIFNRCVKLGISIKSASPIGRLTKKRVEINQQTHVTLQMPSHRLLIDYMLIFKDSLIYNNLGKYSLDYISELILGLHKVSYVGNLKTLYDTDYLRFIAYAIIDTILVMLIHKTTNLLGIEFFQSYYTSVPFARLSQNSISEALVFKELINDNTFLLESEKSTLATRKYQGGYVKTPTAKIIDGVAGFDFGSLYPNSMITVGCSPESKIDVLSCDNTGFPDNEIDEKKWEKYKELGYCLSPMGRVYDVSRDALFTRIEKKLLNERKLYRGHATDIYLNIIPKIEQEIKKRNL